ncbi:hypothetical protein F5Y17DRAFT_58665 [Xylariaceae sp. FL0594]|nr:hypothetical protein F5Y17DRAFT_58665 [Xylariaceae sp. FL0594]
MGHHSTVVHGSRGSKGHGTKTKASGSDKHSDGHRASKSSNPGPEELTFLFVVNELKLSSHVEPTVDQWGTEIPSDRPSQYEGEYVGKVFRYVDGRIEEAPRYFWIRNEGFADAGTGARYHGQIVYQHDDGFFYPTEGYATRTIFNCWRPLPCIFVNVDTLSTPIGQFGDGTRWCLMGFTRPDYTGITRISRGGGGCQVVGGRGPTWMPSLVPAMFENMASDMPQSVGLSGSLPMIIGQMALAYPPHRTDEPFATGKWRGKRWRGEIQQGAEVTEPGGMRGVLVHVALDSFMYPEFSTPELLMNLEDYGCVITD